MAIIKCPECGRQVSEKAPSCPNCGVEIAGKIEQCGNCGNLYFKEDKVCPVCHHSNEAHRSIQTPPANQTVETNETARPSADKTAETARHTEPESPQKKKNRTTLIVSLVLVALVAAVSLYIYKDSSSRKEEKAYTLAMQSNDPTLLENFLVNFPDASQERLDSIQARLKSLQLVTDEWNNVLVSKSKTALLDFLSKYPDTPHKGTIQNMIDSIDWELAVAADNTDLFQQYLNDHPYGVHAEEARLKIGQIRAKTVSQDERQMIDALLTKFFRSINSRSEESLVETLSMPMTSFLNLSNPTDADVVGWMRRQYKDSVKDIVWRVGHSYEVSKREVGDDVYEYTVKFSGKEEVNYTDSDRPSDSNNYRITAVVSPDGKISAMTMNKIINKPTE